MKDYEVVQHPDINLKRKRYYVRNTETGRIVIRFVGLKEAEQTAYFLQVAKEERRTS